MKRKSIYTILWRVLLFCLAWRLASVAEAGTAITVYLVFLPPVSYSGSACQSFICWAWLCFSCCCFPY
ncbi:hypothetical protein [Bacteroides clarus]|uniref:hypothetical protein n=1 Tax=Bacteroides clarus TaxID=626929 RepID=UPI001EF5B7E2|nr:hypothetical protein [Bacteroides clarus]